jgi:NTP pyrophosphatase (non-canonical NTP hydrolase)
VGINSEAGELADALKRSVFYGKPLDKANVGEELGDLLWYVVEAAHAVGMTLSEVMEKNVAKLKVRYPTEFTETAALNRDLDAERMTLEERSK